MKRWSGRHSLYYPFRQFERIYDLLSRAQLQISFFRGHLVHCAASKLHKWVGMPWAERQKGDYYSANMCCCLWSHLWSRISSITHYIGTSKWKKVMSWPPRHISSFHKECCDLSGVFFNGLHATQVRVSPRNVCYCFFKSGHFWNAILK